MTDLIFASNHYSWYLLLEVAGVLGLLIDVEGHGVVLPVGPEGAVLQVEIDFQEIFDFFVLTSVI